MFCFYLCRTHEFDRLECGILIGKGTLGFDASNPVLLPHFQEPPLWQE